MTVHTPVRPLAPRHVASFVSGLFDLPAVDTRDPIRKRYEDEWKPANGYILSLFRRFAREVLATGRTHYGAKALAERVRWHVFAEARGGDDFVLNNSFVACIARDLMEEGTVPAGFFETRVRAGDEGRA